MNRTVFIDKNKCIGCYACTVACKIEHNLAPHPTKPPIAEPEGPELIRVHQVGPHVKKDEVHQYFLPISCMHCDDAPCINACPRSAIYKDRETGTTLVDEDKCIGCKFCLWVCPYGAPQFYGGKLKLCDLCTERYEEGKKTACEAACQARAIFVATTKAISSRMGMKAAERADEMKKNI